MILPSKKIKDITGNKYNNLTAIEFSHIKNNKTYWLFKCDCGKSKVIRADSVTRLKTHKCGCYEKHDMRGTREYSAWISMRSRCFNKKDKDYMNYGDRGGTLKKENAERFRLKVQAKANLTVIRKRYGRPFCDAEILEVEK